MVIFMSDVSAYIARGLWQMAFKSVFKPSYNGL